MITKIFKENITMAVSKKAPAKKTTAKKPVKKALKVLLKKMLLKSLLLRLVRKQLKTCKEIKKALLVLPSSPIFPFYYYLI